MDPQQQQWQQQYGQHHSYHHPMTLEEVKTLWIGDLQYWMDENYLRSIFSHTGEVISAKVIRNKQTGYPEGYGFVEFNSHPAAERILQTYNGTQMPQTDQPFRLNWASFGMGEKRVDGGPEHSIFVGDLAPDVTDYMLQETFRSRYPSIRGAKVVIDAVTGRSKGYGFVRFGDETERARAMSEMNGVYCSTRPMRISAATPKKALAAAAAQTAVTYKAAATPTPSITTAYQTPSYGTPPPPPPPPPMPSQAFIDNDPTNTTIFVGGLDPNVGEEELRQTFGQFGELVYVKIPQGKGCGFVQFTHRTCAEDALHRLHGTVIGTQAIRLSWGRSPANKAGDQFPQTWAQAADANQWSSYYGYGYEGYGYTSAQDYGYASYGGGAYGAYPHQQVVESKDDEIFDPLAPPDIDKLNAVYMVAHESSLLGKVVWMKSAAEQIQISTA